MQTHHLGYYTSCKGERRTMTEVTIRQMFQQVSFSKTLFSVTHTYCVLFTITYQYEYKHQQHDSNKSYWLKKIHKYDWLVITDAINNNYTNCARILTLSHGIPRRWSRRPWDWQSWPTGQSLCTQSPLKVINAAPRPKFLIIWFIIMHMPYYLGYLIHMWYHRKYMYIGGVRHGCIWKY